MFTVGTDPNWQQDKLARLMQALELAKARREKKKQVEEAKAGQRFQLILSAAEKNPNALATPTVRDFVEKNSALIPGLSEWYGLEMQNPARNAYQKLLDTADATATGAEVGATAPGPAGFVARGARAVLREQPEVAIEGAVKTLLPSERIRATQYAEQTGAKLPLSDPGEINKKLSGPAYVLHNAERFSPEEVRASRIALQLEEPRADPAQKVTGALYVLEHPEQFGKETVEAARYQLDISQPPWEAKGPEDKLSGAFAVLNNPRAYTPEAVRYARALARQSERAGTDGGGRSGNRDESESDGTPAASHEKGRMTEAQALGQVDDYVSGLASRFEAANLPLRQLTPAQKRRAAQALRNGEDVDSYLVNTLLPSDGRSLDRVVQFHVSQPSVRVRLQERGENPKARAAKIRADALREVQRLTRSGMNAAQARAQVFLDLLEGAP